MKCVIQNVLQLCSKKPRRIAAIKRYLKMKYNIKIDSSLLRKRLEQQLPKSNWEIA